MKNYVKITAAVLVAASLATALTGCAAYSAKQKTGNVNKRTSLPVHEDGSFRVLQITDMHLISNGTNKRDKQSMQWLAEAIEMSQPDLVVMSGDITGNRTKDRDKGILAVANFMEEHEIYWTYAFGNHDGEHGKNENNKETWLGKQGTRTEVSTVCKNAKYDKSKGELFYGDNTRGNKQIFDLLGGYAYCLLRQDPLEKEHSKEMGIGNYVIDLVNQQGETVYALIHMDSHAKTYFEPVGNQKGAKGCQDAGYLGLTDMQLKWYEDIIQPYAQKDIKTALIMHVPHYGYRELVEEQDGETDYAMPKFKERTSVADAIAKQQFKDTKFMKNEGIYGPRWDEGLEVLLDQYKSTNLVTVGHDHNNCFFLKKDISHKYADEAEQPNEILLCYGRCSGVNAWGRRVDVGATVYDIDTNAKDCNAMYEIQEIYPSFPCVTHYKPAEIDSRKTK